MVTPTALGRILEITSAEHERVRAHYASAADWLVHHFGGTPVIAATYPAGLGAEPVYQKDLAAAPKTIARIDVRTPTGTHVYARLDAHNLTWLVAGKFAVEFHSWSPTTDDPQRAAFARFILAPHGGASDEAVFAAAAILRDALATEGLQAIAVMDGFRGASLWIPFDDGPEYDRLAPWAHAFASRVALLHPNELTTAPLLKDRGDRVSIGTKSNHPGMGSLLPYALRGTPSLDVALPFGWHDLGKVRNGTVTATNFREYQRLFGDVFGRELQRIRRQSFGDRKTGPATNLRTLALAASEPSSHGYIIAAALQVLADGAPHDADDILAQALARNLLPATTTRKYVYTALHEYVERALGAGKIPELVQVAGGTQFRLNEPADLWPAIALPPLPRWLAPEAAEALGARLRATSIGGDPAAFEIAACDAFAALGFIATHVGGNGAPDGILAAPLGVDGYRAVLECKSAAAGGVVANPRPEEPAKFRTGANARFALLLGPAFGNDASLDSELALHDVSLWTVEDVATSLSASIGPDELRAALVAGRSSSALRTLLWERDHGRRKRVEVIARLVTELGWDVQRTLARGVAQSDTPALTAESLFMLVDEELVRQNVSGGAALDEAREALLLLETRGVLRSSTGGYVVREPPSLAAAS